MSHKILVTGDARYIGSHTTVELQNAGFEVIIIDNFSNSNPEVLNGIEKITGTHLLSRRGIGEKKLKKIEIHYTNKYVKSCKKKN